MLLLNFGSLESIVVKGSLGNSLRVDIQLGVVLSRNYLDLFLQQVSFLGQVLNLSKGVPDRDKVLSIQQLILSLPWNTFKLPLQLGTFVSLDFHLESTSSRSPAHDTSSVLSQDTLISLLKGALDCPFFDPSMKVHSRWYYPGNYVFAYLPLIP